MTHSDVRARLSAALPAVLVGVFAGVAAVAGSYATAGFTPEFVVRPIAAWLTATVPDPVLAIAIERLGDLGQKLNLVTAVFLAIAGVAALAVASQAVGRRLDNRAVPAVTTAVGTAGITFALTGAPLSALGAGLPAGVAVLLGATGPSLPVPERVDAERRRLLTGGLSVAVFGVAGYVLGTRRTPSPGGGRLAGGEAGGAAGSGSDGETSGSGASERQDLLAEARQRSFEFEGAEPLVSENHYTVDINAVDPTVDAAEWTLTVTGAVEEEITVDYDQLTAMEAVDRFETLRCVGESLNGKKMDTALWTGVPVADLLERAGPQSGCECVMLRAVDDYHVQFPLSALEDGLLAYGMNDRVLPREHGYPVRALVPGHWGEVQVKWLSEIELLDEAVDGYWEKRGWQGTGPVETVAKLHAVTDLDDGRTEVGGHAYAGTRGIERVEVSTDGGDAWTEAELSDPLPGPDGGAALDAWRQWRYRYDPPAGSHEVVVRAVDGTGELQPVAESDAFPSGPTGWVSETIE